MIKVRRYSFHFISQKHVESVGGWVYIMNPSNPPREIVNIFEDSCKINER